MPDPIKTNVMKHYVPEFPEQIVTLVQRFGAANTYPDFSRDEAIETIESGVEELIERGQAGLGEGHQRIIAKIEIAGPGFLFNMYNVGIMIEGCLMAGPSKRMAGKCAAALTAPDRLKN